jgi:hypothetical protein
MTKRRDFMALATHHLLAEKFKSLESAHRLCAGLNILKHNMSLTTHFAGLHGYDVEDGTVGRKQSIERQSQIVFAELVW